MYTNKEERELSGNLRCWIRGDSKPIISARRSIHPFRLFIHYVTDNPNVGPWPTRSNLLRASPKPCQRRCLTKWIMSLLPDLNIIEKKRALSIILICWCQVFQKQRFSFECETEQKHLTLQHFWFCLHQEIIFL